MARFASVYPLVTTRALARPFTYLGDGLEKGSVVMAPLGRAHRRGVVVGTAEEPPDGVEPVAVDRVLGQMPPPLVDLALWLADYYGSTPGTRARPGGAPSPPPAARGPRRAGLPRHPSRRSPDRRP